MTANREGLITLVYASTASQPFRETALAQLLVEFRRFNTENHITGMLLFRDGRFIQVLEGAPSVIESLLERIGRDSRHHDVRILVSEPITERKFADWSMGYRSFRRGVEPVPAGFRDSFADLESATDASTTARALGELTLWFRTREAALS
ncbi:BLUF domain-containing protein [Microbacterium nymphoidis]|uniref:BLUF domain-containing protein n=1 Tax=Microbacterium nymphoidis TaxID=2898586 RepID=UPI001E509C41|nr:BLUF domain-containing protein [Microbacterium nymphoidis]MCD2497556.1 BLUF domain-containing protein [Microbacterium nymphoidis]